MYEPKFDTLQWVTVTAEIELLLNIVWCFLFTVCKYWYAGFSACHDFLFVTVHPGHGLPVLIGLVSLESRSRSWISKSWIQVWYLGSNEARPNVIFARQFIEEMSKGRSMPWMQRHQQLRLAHAVCKLTGLCDVEIPKITTTVRRKVAYTRSTAARNSINELRKLISCADWASNFAV